MKADPGISDRTIPLSCFHKLFLEHFTRTGALKKTALKPTASNWLSHDGIPQNFLGHIVLDIQHKILPQILPFKFFIFEDITSPYILLSYPASWRLGIVEFKVPNEMPVFPPAILDAIKRAPKRVTFSTHLDNTAHQPHNSRNHMPDLSSKPISRTTCCQSPLFRTI